MFIKNIDILLALGGGSQTKDEVIAAKRYGGRMTNGIPIIAIDDPVVGNWTHSRRRVEGVEYFKSSNLQQASLALNNHLESILHDRASILR